MDTSGKIKELLAKYGIESDRVTPETTMQSFRFLSEEIMDFLKDFGNYFDIDFTGFNYHEYFLEDAHPGIAIENLVYRIFKPDKLQRKSITIDHLIKVAESKKWFNPC